ncbi:hypothetical protein VTL71DRAFT_9007 [Oculimacula yallundae]|uniref:Uncharacterized protein n=1 Tax=Oculimacula yallundae TaxID=86028 RepID=A0ABR4BTI5_9HELO
MAQIYKRGLMTIPAGSATTVHEGFLQTRMRPAKELPSVTLPFCSADWTWESGSIVLEEQYIYTAHFEPLNRRAWSLRERLRSPQVIVYTSSTIIRPCQTEESGVARKSYSTGSERLDATSFKEQIAPHVSLTKILQYKTILAAVELQFGSVVDGFL